MYGLAGQSLGSWETTLADAICVCARFDLDLLLFVNQGRGLHERGAAAVYRCRPIVTCKRNISWRNWRFRQPAISELPNDFWARGTW